MLKKISILVSAFLFPVSLMAMEATFYSDSFEGGSTANGDTFSQRDHTAAICAENLGQLVYVSRWYTGVTVRANDRPNCARSPDLIDLTSSVFSRFAPLSSGRLRDVSVQPLAIDTGNFSKRDLSQWVFASLWVELSKPISNTYFAGESITLQGRVTTQDTYVMTYLEDKRSGKKYSQSYPVGSNGSFRIVISFPSGSGEYYFVIAAGTSFRTQEPPSIFLVDVSSFNPSSSLNSSASYLWLRPEASDQGMFLNLPENIWGTLRLTTNSGMVDVFGQTLSLAKMSIAKGPAMYTFTGYTLSTPSSLDRSPTPTYVSSGQIILDDEHGTSGAERVRVIKQAQWVLFRFRIPTGEQIPPTYYVTLPSGDVLMYEFSPKYLDPTTGFLRTGLLIQATFPTNVTGTYKLEVNSHDGFAYFNIPVVRGNVWNIVPPLSDAEIRNKKVPIQTIRTQTIHDINTLRARMWRMDLGADTALTTLAQKKAEDMAQYDYVWHTTHGGYTIRSFGESLGINIVTAMWENVAGGNVSAKALQLGLEESGSHRANMIDPDWKKVWIGFVVSGDKTYLVQLFAE